MKTNLTIQKRFLLCCVMFLMMFVGKGYSQLGAGDYNLCVRNMHQTSPSVLEFDVFLEWTNPAKTNLFNFFQGGMDFNYAGVANGGVISAQFVALSADGNVPAAAKNPNWNLNQSSKQIRFLAAIVTPAVASLPVPGPPGMRLGTLRLFNTVPFTANTQPNFVWNYTTGTNRTQTKEGFYVNGSLTASGFVDATGVNHCAIPNPFLNPPCPTANAGGPYSSCGDVHLNGSIANATTGTWTTSGSGTFDPNNTTLTATYHPSAADLAAGSVTLTLTTDPGACTPAVSNATATFTSTNDNNACTTDGCDQSTGIATHTAVDPNDNNVCTTDACNSITGVSHTPISVDDNNACTVDGCNSITGPTHAPLNTDDGNACTIDGCNTATGATHDPVNISDGNACTTDACDTQTGAITHTAVNTDDGNACTTDACDTQTGAITHTAVNTDDGNACTTDACNTQTGAITHTDRKSVV